MSTVNPFAPVSAPPSASPAAPAAPPAAPPMVGAPSMPGMRSPKTPGTPGAGAGRLTLTMAPSVVVRGTYDIRPKRFVNSARMKNPKLVFEVFDENEMAKSKRGEKSVNGAEIDITLWADARTYQLFRDMGYPDSAWHTNPDGTIDLPIHAVVNTDRPLLTCEIDWKEGNTPGQGFYSFKSVVRKKERTT